MPLAEEVELVQNSAEPANLGHAEKFVLAVGTVPRLRARLDCFAYKHKFNQQLYSLYADVRTLTTAAQQLVGCAPLRRLLGMLLRLGNALNAGSFRAGAEGFKPECLPRLAELRTNAEQSNLLQFALAAADAHHRKTAAADDSAPKDGAPLAPLSAQLPMLKAAARLSTSELTEDISKLDKGLKLLHDELVGGTPEPMTRPIEPPGPLLALGGSLIPVGIPPVAGALCQ